VDFVQKPFGYETLIQVMRKAVEKEAAEGAEGSEGAAARR